MDGIESITGTASPASLLLSEMGGATMPERLPTSSDFETALASSDAQKLKFAKDFESILLTRLFDEIRESIGNCAFEEDPAGEQIQGMFWSYLAQDVADKGGFGLSQEICRHLQDMDGAETAGALMDKEL